MMRWKGVIAFFVIIALVVVISIFFMNRWVESGLEKTGQAITGAKVEIDGLNVSPLSLSIEWRRLQVTNPQNTMSNIVETGRAAFKMNMPALLRKRVVIREMALEDVQSGTQRTHDGALPKKIKKPKKKSGKPGAFDKVKASLNNQVQSLPVMEFDPDALKRKLNLDSLIVMTELTLPQRLDSAKQDILATGEDWEHFFQTFRPDKDLEKIKNDFTDLDPTALKSVPELMSTLEKVQTAQKTLNALQDTVKIRHLQINSDFERVSQYAASADDWFREDYRNILNKAKLPDLNVKNIGMMLFGSTIVHRIDQILSYVETARKYLPKKSDKNQKQKPERGKGQNILFPNRYAYPTFLIQTIKLSGQTGHDAENPGLILNGNAAGITSQPWIYGKPTTVNIDGVKQDGRSINLSANLNHIAEVEKDQFKIVMNNVSLNNVALYESRYLPSKIRRGSADIELTADFEKDDFTIRLRFISQDLSFNFSEMKTRNRFISILQEVMAGMDRITLDADVSSSGEGVKMGMNSNLDTQVSRELKRMGSQALTDAQNKVRARLEMIKVQKMNEVRSVYDEKEKFAREKIEYYEQKVDEQRLMIEAKIDQIKKDIDVRKKKEEDQLKNKARGVLDGVLK